MNIGVVEFLREQRHNFLDVGGLEPVDLLGFGFLHQDDRRRLDGETAGASAGGIERRKTNGELAVKRRRRRVQ